MPSQTSTPRRGEYLKANAARRVSHLQPVDTYEDPRFGLEPDVLRALFTGEPVAGWDDVRLVQLAEAARAVWSRILGESATGRKAVGQQAKLVGLAAIAGWRDPEGGIHAPLAVDDLAEVMAIPGWGGGELSWRKLHAYGEMDLRLERGQPDRVLRIGSDRDFNALNMAWQRVSETVHQELPAPVLSAFLSGPREIQGTRLPGVLQATALLLSWGPEGARRAMLAALKLHANKTGNRTLKNYAAQFNGFADAAKKTAPSHVILAEQHWLAPWETLKHAVKGIVTRPASETERDVSSPGVLATRRAFIAARERVETHRARSGALRPQAHSEVFRAALLNVQTATSARIEMTSGIAPIDCEREGVCGDYVGPLIWVTTNKDGVRRREPRPVHDLVIDSVDDLCEVWGIPRDDTTPLFRNANGRPLSPSSLGKRFTQEGSRISTLLPRMSGERATSHSVRHLGAQVAASVAAQIIDADPVKRGAMDPDAVADLWLGHVLKTDVHGYRDIQRNRTALLVLVGAGDPERQIPGIRDVLWGEAGARKAWDEEAIRTQHDVALQSTVRAATLRTQIAAATADQDRLCRAPLEIPIPESDPLPPVISETLSVDASILAGMSQRELIQRVLTITAESAGMAHREHERTRDVIAAATAAADQRMRDLHGLAAEITRLTHSQRESERSAERAELSLEKLRLGGPTRPIADADPTTAELRTLTGDRAIRARDDETWDALLERVGTECSTAEAGRLRAWLNHREVLAITGLPARTLQRYRLGESSHPLALGIQRADWVELGDKLFFVHADTLPLHLFLPTQLGFLGELLSLPMGSVHGGRRRTDAEIEEVRMS